MMNLLICLFFLLPALAQETLVGPTASLTELGNYLEKRTQGSVRLVKQAELQFNINPVTNEATPLADGVGPDFVHSLFETDIIKYIENAGTIDFVSAKKKFYQGQTYSVSTAQYSRPYIYLSDWQGLNHNPIRSLNLPLMVYGKQFQPLDSKSIEKSPLLRAELHHRLDKITNTEMTAGNRLRLLNNGQVSFKEKVRMVKQAKKFFHSIVMVQYCDETSSEIVDAMIERAQAGVDVRLIMEKAWSTLILRKCVAKLRRGGVKVHLGQGFLQRGTWFTIHHTKFWIRDGEEAIIGGQNILDFENSSNGFNNHTRDKDVHVRGPAVTDLMYEYIKIWNNRRLIEDPDMRPYLAHVKSQEINERAKGLRGSDLYDHWLNQADVSAIPGVCRVLVQGNKLAPGPTIISKAYLEIMKNVKYSMLINTLSLKYDEDNTNEVGNSSIVRTIIDRTRNGVKVDIVSNGYDGGIGSFGHTMRRVVSSLRNKGSHWLANKLENLHEKAQVFMGKSNQKNLFKMVKASPMMDAWTYFNHIHSKQMMFDHIMTSTGSFNLDKFSWRNHESTMICIDKALADESMLGFVSDVINSVPVLKD